LAAVVLLGDQLAIPAKQGVRSDDAGDSGQGLSTERLGADGKPSTPIEGNPIEPVR